MSVLPIDSKLRKNIPLARGLLDYFPNALAAVAELSRIGNDKHNPGEPLHWSKHLSNDHADCIVRHLLERGTVDPTDNVLHSTKVAWRALAMLQIELEEAAKPPLSAPEPECDCDVLSRGSTLHRLRCEQGRLSQVEQAPGRRHERSDKQDRG